MSGFAEAADPIAERKKELKMLSAQRDALELLAGAIASELNSPGANGEPPVGTKGPLVDRDGFPLAGFDLFNVREKRHRLNCIQTDHKAVMSKLEKALHALHEAQPVLQSSSSPSTTPSTSSSAAGTRTRTLDQSAVNDSRPSVGDGAVQSVPMTPLATVNQVSEGSPADTAGLTVGDLVLRFGNVDISHPKGMAGIVDVVRENEGREVPVLVLHQGLSGGAPSGVRELKLTPRTWSGRGLLGVHLLPP